MVRSNLIVVLSLVVLVAVCGCSGSQVRQIFTPDREFMALSELDELADTEVAESRPPRSFSDVLVSWTKAEPDANDAESEDVAQAGFLRRLLKSRQDDGLPEDPFLDSQDFQESLPVIAAGEVRDLADTDPGPAKSNRTPTPKSRRPEVTTALVQDDADKSKDGTGPDTASLSDFISDFRHSDDDFPPADRDFDQNGAIPETGDIEALATNAAGDGRDAAEDDVDDFIAFVSRATNDDRARDESDTSADDKFKLDVGLLDELTSEDSFDDDETNSALALPDGFDEDPTAETAEALIRNTALTAADLFAAEAETASDAGDQAFADLFDEKVAATDGTIRHPSTDALSNSSDESFEWHQPDVTADESAGFKSLWSGFSDPSFTSSAESQKQGSQFGSSQAHGNNPFFSTASGAPVKPVSHGASSTAEQGAFENDPFLADFESQADATAATMPPVSGAGSLGGIAPRIWLLLLAGVIVLYLLIVPERRNPSYPNNR